MPKSRRYITGNSRGDSSLEFQLDMLCNPSLRLNSIYEALENAPEDLVETEAPTGKFWIVGPASNGLCFAYKKGPSYGEAELTVHRQSDLAKAGFTPKLIVAQVKR